TSLVALRRWPGAIDLQSLPRRSTDARPDRERALCGSGDSWRGRRAADRTLRRLAGRRVRQSLCLGVAFVPWSQIAECAHSCPVSRSAYGFAGKHVDRIPLAFFGLYKGDGLSAAGAAGDTKSSFKSARCAHQTVSFFFSRSSWASATTVSH